MTRVPGIARRGLLTLLVSPAGWALAALFVLLTSVFGFVLPVFASRAATLDGVFGFIASFLLPFVAPAITALVFAGKSSDTRPSSGWERATGRWLASSFFYVLLLATTLVYVVVLAVYEPGHLTALDLGLLASSYAGLLIAGGTATAVAVLASTLFDKRIVAFPVAVAALLLTWYAGVVLGFLAQAPVNQVFQYAAASNHYQFFGLGLLTLKDLVYLVSVGAAALFLAARRLDSKRATLAPAAIAMVALLAFNVLASKSTLSWDLTRGGLNTLSPQSIAAAKRLDANLLVVGLFRASGGSGQAEAEALVGLYQAQSPRIAFRSESFDTDVSDVRNYSVQEPNTLVLDYGGKTELLTPALQTELDFTSALLKLESNHVPVVCWTGAGGPSRTDTSPAGYTGVADVLARNDFATMDLPAAGFSAIPAACDEVALIGPMVALPATTIRAVDDYLVAGGSLLIAGDPWGQAPAATASLNEILKPYGVAFSGALVVEPDAARAFDVITPAIFTYASSPITRDIQGIASVFPQTTAISGTAAPGATAVVIAATSSLSYAIGTPRQDLTRQSADAAGPLAIMETLEVPTAKADARIAVVGTSAFAENKLLPPNSNAANLEMALGTFEWLARQDGLISISPKPPRALPLLLTQQGQGTVILIAAFLLPGLLVLAGGVAWWRRRLVR